MILVVPVIPLILLSNMSLNKLFIIFGVIFVIFAAVVFFQFRGNNANVKSQSTANNTVEINNHTFKVEAATTPEKQQQGLSGRTSLPQDQGMLFVFEKSDYQNFWMKNMKFPIDIIFINDDLVISVVANAQPPKTDTENPQIIKSSGVANRVLEINAGLAEKYDIKEGDKVEIKLQK